MPEQNSDITRLILDDHDTFRRGFAALDDLAVRNDPEELSRVWEPLGNLLDVHAIAEEEIFYPQLLRKADDAEDETLDAIGDHNDIRDGVRDAAQVPVGSEAWWDAVGQARMANDEHMAEEEREGLADFRKSSTVGLRQALGRRFLEFKTAHPSAEDLDTRDKDPQGYVDAVARREGVPNTSNRPDRPSDGSLGIGSLKGR